MGSPTVLVLGGTRSGKSTLGLRRIRELAKEQPIAYLATAAPGDPELDDRIRRHLAARPSDWLTVQVGADLPRAIRAAGDEHAILLDGLTLWLSALVPTTIGDIDAFLDGPVADGLAALAGHAGPLVVVSDEIGLGMVPLDAFARAFRDVQGIVHQRLAQMSDEVILTVAGLPLYLKRPLA